jgi:hypothetical protein
MQFRLLLLGVNLADRLLNPVQEQTHSGPVHPGTTLLSP